MKTKGVFMKRLFPGASARRGVIGRAMARSSMSMSMSIWLAASSVLLSMFLLGCPGTLDPGVGPGPATGVGGSSGAGCEAAIFMTKCALSGCHATISKAANLDLELANPASRLVGVATADATAGGSCAGKKLLDMPSSPATGVFIDKITNDAQICGSPMPLGGSLTADQLTCLTSWATTVTGTSAFTGEAAP
jgi:hypothetical protein